MQCSAHAVRWNSRARWQRVTDMQYRALPDAASRPCCLTRSSAPGSERSAAALSLPTASRRRWPGFQLHTLRHTRIGGGRARAPPLYSIPRANRQRGAVSAQQGLAGAASSGAGSAAAHALSAAMRYLQLLLGGARLARTAAAAAAAAGELRSRPSGPADAPPCAASARRNAARDRSAACARLICCSTRWRGAYRATESGRKRLRKRNMAAGFRRAPLF